MYDLVIRGGTVVTPQEVLRADLAVTGERIAAIGGNLDGRREVDAEGCLVLPGVIDAHTHMALPVSGTRSSDDFLSGTTAAAFGGVTTIVDFTVGDIDRTISEDIDRRFEEARFSVIDYALHGEVVGWRPGQEDQFRAAVERGVTSFKFFTAYAASGRRSESGVLYHAFREISRLGAVAVVHAEDDHLVESIVGTLKEGELAQMSSLAISRPDICEGAAIDQVAYYAGVTGARVHIVHISSALGAERLALARSRGVAMTGETCPQYLLLTSDVYDRKDGHLFSASPALRRPMDRRKLWRALASGGLDFAATDHCPFSRRQKEWRGSFINLPYGLPGVETLLSLLHSEGVTRGRLSLRRMVAVLSENVARIYGLYPRKGRLSPGSDADVVVFDPREKWKLSADALHMRTDFSPYEGMEVTGRVRSTISRGDVIIENGLFCGCGGRGRFLARGPEGLFRADD